MSSSDFSKFEIEDFVDYIIDRNLKKNDFTKLLESHLSDGHILEKQLAKMKFAYDRLSKGLNINEIFALIIAPLGKVHRMYENQLFDIERERKNGFIKRVNQYYIFSFIGIIFYILLAFLIGRFL
tara:strand:+ start:123 stop:497 length:375 start_codon:yes stop_codon:yes gene_type:complete